ncbi:MAG: aldo/keto reductase [Armatimonadetes bacterium]|nr:aldo/keto reductase [Armatimonadota bacterium]
MIYRELGKTGRSLSVVGFGGLVVDKTEPAEAARIVAQAVERGITYFDVAPIYGEAQKMLGPALKPYRDQIFLSCKTTRRDRAGSQEELEESLRLAHTNHFDLYQIHAVQTVEEVEQAFGPDGCMETFLAAREAGIFKHIGFSAHTEEAALALMDRFPFDSVMTPLNWACWHAGDYGKRIVERAKRDGLGILALKTLALRPWKDGEERTWPKCWYKPVETLEEAIAALNFTLSLGVTCAISPSHEELLWLLCDAAEHVADLTLDEDAKLIARASELVPLFTIHKKA